MRGIPVRERREMFTLYANQPNRHQGTYFKGPELLHPPAASKHPLFFSFFSDFSRKKALMLAGRIDARERERERERMQNENVLLGVCGCVCVCVCVRGGESAVIMLLGSVFKDHESAHKLKRIPSFENRGERRRNKKKPQVTSSTRSRIIRT